MNIYKEAFSWINLAQEQFHPVKKKKIKVQVHAS